MIKNLRKGLNCKPFTGYLKALTIKIGFLISNYWYLSVNSKLVAYDVLYL